MNEQLVGQNNKYKMMTEDKEQQKTSEANVI